MRDSEGVEPIDFFGVLDALSGLIWTTRDDGRCEFVNRSWRDYTGLGDDESRDHGWQAAIHPADLASLIETWEVIRRTDAAKEIYVRVRRFDCEYRWFTLRPSITPDRPESDRQWCWLGMEADEGPVADGRLRRLFDMLPIQAAFLNREGSTEFTNRQALQEYGMSLEQLTDWSASGAIHPDDHPIVHEQLTRLIETGETFDATLRMRYKDGGYKWMRCRCVPCRDAQGNIARYVTVQSDVHELKHAEDLLAAEVKLLEMVARGEPLEQVLGTLSRSLGELCERWACSVLLIAPDRKRFQSGAGTGLPHAFHQALEGMTPDAGDNPCSMAIVAKAPCTTVEVGDDPRWKGSPWLAGLNSAGFGSCCAMPIISASGEATGVVAIFGPGRVAPTRQEQDVVDRFTKLAGIAIDSALGHLALQTSERGLREVLAQLTEGQRLSRTGTFTSDIQRDQHRWSDEFYRIFEIDPATPARLEFLRNRVHPDDLLSYDIGMGNAVEGMGSDFNFRILTPHGGMKHIRGVAQVTEHTKGRPILMGAVQDITDHRLAEEELERSEAYLLEGQRLSKTGSFSWLMDTNEPVFSEELRRIFGFEDDTPVTLERFFERVHPDDRPLVTERMNAAVHGSDNDYVFRAQMPDGAIKYLRSFNRETDLNKDRPELIGSVVDITDSKLADDALHQTRSELAHVARVATLNAMTASLAHEVSQPLSGILTNANTCMRLLASDPPRLDAATETVRRTIRDANRAEEVIRRLREMFSAKLPSREMADINAVAREVVALSTGELRRNGALLQTDFTEGLPLVSADRIQLQQVILNLLLNGADAMAEIEDRPRTLLIRTGLDEVGNVELLVRDAGVGIDPQNVEKLFDAFYTTKAHGMGVGLSISRSIVERHDGHLRAEANDGPGATFAFSIPVAASEAS